MLTYKVKIVKKPRLNWSDRLDGEFWWDVDTSLNGDYIYELSDCGWSRSLQKAKAKALKHILSSSKKIDTNQEYGVIIELIGTADEISERLS